MVEKIVKAVKGSGQHSFNKPEILELITKVVGETKAKTISSNGIVINPETRTVLNANNQCSFTLPKKLFDLLYYLMSNPNKGLTRNEILLGVWGVGDTVTERNIDVYVKQLRSLIGKELIRTEKGTGYRYDGYYTARLKRLAID